MTDLRVSTAGLAAWTAEAAGLRVGSVGLAVWCVESPLSSCTTTIATIWKIVRRDGVTKRYTTHDVDLVVPGDGTYETCAGVEPGAVELSAELRAGGLDVRGIINPAEISADDIRAGLYNYADFELSRIDWSNPSLPPLLICSGHVGRIAFGTQLFEAVLRTAAHQLQQKIISTMTGKCRWRFGGPECGVDLASHTFTSTVTSEDDRKHFFVTAWSGLTGFFRYGLVTFTTGNNAGQQREVKSFDAGNVELWEALPFEIGVGDGVTITRGCDKTPERCDGDYSNIARNGGFYLLPGNDAIARVPDAHA